MSKFEDYLTEMSNLTPDDTGLDNIVWILPKTNKEKHGPRIKVKIDNELIPISISKTPRVMVKTKTRIPGFSIIQKWIVDNEQLLLDYWNSEGEMSMRIVLDRIKKVGTD